MTPLTLRSLLPFQHYGGIVLKEVNSSVTFDLLAFDPRVYGTQIHVPRYHDTTYRHRVDIGPALFWV